MNNINQTSVLEDKTAIITGASRGIGKAICETLHGHGAHIVACVRNIDDAISQWAEERKGIANGQIILIELDLSEEASIKEAIKNIRKNAPSVDILVNNAGIANGSLFQMTSMAELRKTFEINFFSQILLSQGISRLMARQKSGSIINICSSAAYIPDPGTLAYGTSKASLARATQSMAQELGSMGIRVNAIAPGVTETDMLDEMDPQARDNLIESSALKKAAQPEDIANTAFFLASDLSSHITGQIIRVDGGTL